MGARKYPEERTKFLKGCASQINEILGRTYGSLSGVQLAWAFLRWNDDYRERYGNYLAAPEAIRDAIDNRAGDTRKLPEDIETKWFDLTPPPLTAHTLGEWRAECNQRQTLDPTSPPSSEAVREDLTSDSFGVVNWIDPEITEHKLSREQQDFFLPKRFRIFSHARIGIAKTGPHKGSRKVMQRHVGVLPRLADDGDVAVYFDVRIGLEAQIHQAKKLLRKYADQLNSLEHPEDAFTKKETSIDRLRSCLTVYHLDKLGLTLDEISERLPSRKADEFVPLK